jgi:hypothetical protein
MIHIFRTVRITRLNITTTLCFSLIPLVMAPHLSIGARQTLPINPVQSDVTPTPIPFEEMEPATTYTNLASDHKLAISVKIGTNEPKPKPPRATPTPLLIPPPANPATTNSIIGMSVIMICVILFGLWINRRKITK